MINPIDPDRQDKLDYMFAFAMFKTGRPFTAFEDDAWINFFKELGYKPPGATKLATKLLPKVYKKVELQVSLRFSASNSINLVTDESTDIASHRIINTSGITNNGDCFYISNIEANAGKLGAVELTNNTVATARKATNGDLSKVVSWTTDTCAIMRSM